MLGGRVRGCTAGLSLWEAAGVLIGNQNNYCFKLNATEGNLFIFVFYMFVEEGSGLVVINTN